MSPKNRAYGLKNWLAACFGVVEGSPPPSLINRLLAVLAGLFGLTWL